MTDSAAVRSAADDEHRDPRGLPVPTIRRSPVAIGHVIDGNYDAPSPLINATAGDATIALGPAQCLAPWDLERLQQQLNSSTQTSSSEFDSLVDLLGSREQRIVPLMTSSWLENVNKYSELEGDSAIFASQDSLEVLNWNMGDNCNGRPGSPLRFDHEELLRIDEDQRMKFSDVEIKRFRELEEDFEVKLHTRNDCKCSERRTEDSEMREGELLRRRCIQLTEEKQRLAEQMTRLQKSHEEMKSVITEYEATIEKLIGKSEGCSGSSSPDVICTLRLERDQAIEDLKSVESAFSELHQRFEKTKNALDNCKKNEAALYKRIEELEEKLKQEEEKYFALLGKAEEKMPRIPIKGKSFKCQSAVE